MPITPTHHDLVTLLLGGAVHGDAPCFGFIPDGAPEHSEQIGFAAFVDRARRVARGLAELGVVRGSRVALFARPDVDFMTAMAATLIAGAVVVPINHQFKHRELAGYLGIVDPVLIVTDRDTDALSVAVRPDLTRVIGGASRVGEARAGGEVS
ncbi:MAG TPA: AMP-binding protein, partial [Ilumatobacteraceae bacterium]|nr:AMP-binding protein [Ilumatobacteraceae bacterium]